MRENTITYIQLPYAALKDSRLSSSAKLAYARLRLYVGKNGYCWPSQETLAGEMGLNSRQVRNLLNELRRFGYVAWERWGNSNRYYVYDPPADSNSRGESMEVAAPHVVSPDLGTAVPRVNPAGVPPSTELGCSDNGDCSPQDQVRHTPPNPSPRRSEAEPASGTNKSSKSDQKDPWTRDSLEAAR